jgi:hypothetical protein
MSESEELKLAYAECSRQRNELLNKLKFQAQRQWVGLTDEEQIALLKDSDGKTRHWLVWQVEAKLKEKNT